MSQPVKNIALNQFQALLIARALGAYRAEINAALSDAMFITDNANHTDCLLECFYNGNECEELRKELAYQFNILLNE